MIAFAYSENLLYREEMKFDTKYISCPLVIFLRQNILLSSIQVKFVYYFTCLLWTCNNMSTKKDIISIEE